MDLEEWECLNFGQTSSNSLLLYEVRFNPDGVIDMNHFKIERQEQAELIEDASEDEIVEDIREISIVPPVGIPDTHALSHAIFEKLMANELSDMRIGSHMEFGAIHFDGTREFLENLSSEEEELETEDYMASLKGKPSWKDFSLNIWRWRLKGSAVLCSIGAAAATVCLCILNGQQKHSHQKLGFQFRADNKFLLPIEQVVKQAPGLFEVSSAARGAQISFGGHYSTET